MLLLHSGHSPLSQFHCYNYCNTHDAVLLLLYLCSADPKVFKIVLKRGNTIIADINYHLGLIKYNTIRCK